MNSTLLHSIESFPPLSESINKMNELCRFEDVDLKAFIRLIESDPLLYTDILRYSNVPYHGFSNPITSISQAIALFGISAIRGMALTAELKANPSTDLTPYGITVDQWFAVMEKQQRFLDLWLRKKHRAMLQSLGGLTFILEIGRLISSYSLMFNNNAYCFTEDEPEKLSLEEKNVVGASGDELAATLFELWNFDKLFVNSLGYSLNPENGLEPEICAAIKCARTLFNLKYIKAFEEVEPMLKQFNFDRNDANVAYEILLTQG
ncbi:HDOD domain-containing protein [Sulfuricurvum sp.]|uniref:HDOD domain-containing protein n=1 Tax=Sulfuricurvum sp. TaxID=2025608 RepID=UPI00356A278F